MSTTEIERRLLAVEEEIARLKAERSKLPATHPARVLESIRGAFANDEAFEEAMRLGRKWRESQDRAARKPRAKRKRSEPRITRMGADMNRF